MVIIGTMYINSFKKHLTKRVDSAKKAMYCGYKRFGRQDLLSLIKTTDLYTIHHTLWPKHNAPSISF